MNYFNLVKNIQDTALKHQFVQEFFEGDVYDIMNTKDRKYPTVILTTERIDDTNGYQTITASLFCIDRLTSDGVNKLEVQSICQTILQGILLKLESTYPEMTIQTESFVPFTEKFKDLCAGMYVECSLSYPSVICDDEVFTTKEIILKSNGIYDVIGYDRAIVSVETPTQSRQLSISANGSYAILPDEGYYLDELKLDVDVPLKLPTGTRFGRSTFADIPNTPATYNEYNLSWLFTSSLIYRANFQPGDLTYTRNVGYAFRDCSRLTQVTFHEGALTQVTVAASLFEGCSSLRTLEFPDNALQNVTGILYLAGGCSKLSSLKFGNNCLRNTTSVGSGFYNCKALKTIEFGENCFEKANSLYSTFEGCNSLIELEFPEGTLKDVSRLDKAFYSCYAITSIIFPEGSLQALSASPWGAFSFCRSLKDLVIYNLPNSNLTNTGLTTCTSLTLQSLQNILNALPVTTSGYRCTIGTTNLNKLSAADIQIATDKGWTLN